LTAESAAAIKIARTYQEDLFGAIERREFSAGRSGASQPERDAEDGLQPFDLTRSGRTKDYR
jgi:hypothetical protein